ncbi:MAG: hypothetical protein MZV64_61170 [Ignavibacteriales bacterium]|nr:hypothetical protein [Ignavibacteriales bacterium]
MDLPMLRNGNLFLAEIGKSQAGAGDISHVVSGGHIRFNRNETIPVAFNRSRS